LQAIFTSTDVVQVNISAEAGDMGILANHVPSIEALRPGVVEVIETAGGSTKWFSASRLSYLWSLYLILPCTLASSGFATVHPNNKLTINVVEAAPLENFSIEV